MNANTNVELSVTWTVKQTHDTHTKQGHIDTVEHYNQNLTLHVHGYHDMQ